MTPAIHSDDWTEAQLEAFHDGELIEDERLALTEALRRSPALRARLAEIARCDAVARAALTTEPAAQSRRMPAPAWRLRAPLAVAAALGLVVTASIIYENMRGATGPFALKEPDSHETVHAQPAERGDGIVLSLVLTRKPAEAQPQRAPRAATDLVRSFDAALERALSAGDIDAATALLADASPAQRALATERLGRVVRTGRVAEQILQSLPLDDQLELCEAWVDQPHLRYASFTRLSALANNPDMREAVALTVEQLRAKPALAGWLRSYGLVDPST